MQLQACEGQSTVCPGPFFPALNSGITLQLSGLGAKSLCTEASPQSPLSFSTNFPFLVDLKQVMNF